MRMDCKTVTEKSAVALSLRCCMQPNCSAQLQPNTGVCSQSSAGRPRAPNPPTGLVAKCSWVQYNQPPEAKPCSAVHLQSNGKLLPLQWLPELRLVDSIAGHAGHKFIAGCCNTLCAPRQSHGLVQEGLVRRKPAEAVRPGRDLPQHVTCLQGRRGGGQSKARLR